MAGEETIPAEPLESVDPSPVGPYRLLGRLDQGGMGSVYLARGADGRPMAVKALLGRFDSTGAVGTYRMKIERR